MHEHLELERGVFPDRRDFTQCQFSRQHRALNTEAFRNGNAEAVMQRHLRACMQLESGKIPAADIDYPKVLYDDPVDLELFKLIEKVDGLFELYVLDENIQGYVDFSFKGMRIRNKVRKRTNGEIPRAKPGVEINEPEVYGIGPRVYGRMETFNAPRGCEQFRFFN